MILRHATDEDKKVTAKMVEPAKVIQTFASGHSATFLGMKYLEDCEKARAVVDPELYLFKAGKKLQQRRVNDVRPLLKRQRNNDFNLTETTAISHIRKY